MTAQHAASLFDHASSLPRQPRARVE